MLRLQTHRGVPRVQGLCEKPPPRRERFLAFVTCDTCRQDFGSLLECVSLMLNMIQYLALVLQITYSTLLYALIFLEMGSLYQYPCNQPG
jgi:hypothetical protein